MQSLEQLRQHNQDIAELLDVLTVLMEHENLRGNPNVCSLVAKFHDKVWTHLVLDDNELYGELLGDADPQIRDAARQFHDRARDIKKHFAQHVKHWCHPEQLEGGHDAFVEEAKKIFRQVREQIDYENQQMFPLLEKNKV